MNSPLDRYVYLCCVLCVFMFCVCVYVCMCVCLSVYIICCRHCFPFFPFISIRPSIHVYNPSLCIDLNSVVYHGTAEARALIRRHEFFYRDDDVRLSVCLFVCLFVL